MYGNAATARIGPSALLPGEVALHDLVRDVAVKGGAVLNGRLTVLLPAPGAVVRADPEQLTQALLDLLRHAAVFGRADAVVDLRVLRERDAWRFEVAEEVGVFRFDEEESVFEPLNRERGLGLALIRGVAEAHGGSAGVELKSGGRTTFWFRLPKRL